MFTRGDMVMAARPTGGKYIWWPAEVQDNAKATEELLVRFVGAKRSSRVSDAVHFTARASDLDFERADVAEAFDAAVQKGAKLNPVVNLPRIHDHPVMQPVLQLRRVQGFEKRTPPEVEQVQPTRQSLEEKPEQEQLPPILKKKRDEDMCELELLRQRNIEERNAMFAKLKAELKESLSAIVPKRPPPSRRQQRPRFQGLRFLHRRDPVNTRARTRLTSGGSSSVSSNGSTPRKYYYEDEDFLDENVTYVKQERRYHPSRWLHNPNEDTLKPEDITDDMLENVADYYSQKVHCPRRGSTCHQCRQKTLDTKTVCRSGVCVGVRGQFCGVCLLHRYGENARSALKDPNWTCPVCLDACNCSICRNRIGKGATGAITYLAQSKGFKSVKDYLESLITHRDDD